MIPSKEIANNYFDAFNSSSIDAVRACFSDDITLSYWNVNVTGIGLVIEEYIKIFQSLEDFSVNILHLYEIDSTIVAELVINAKKIETIKVVDIIKINEKGKIFSIKAYKG